MKRAFIAIFAFVIIVFIYFGGKSAIEFYKNYKLILNDNVNSGTFGFKQNPENQELVSIYLKIADNLIAKLPEDNTLSSKDKILDSYKLIDYFPDFKDYYSVKLKLSEAVFNELTPLYNSTVKLSENELKTFFSKKSDYLDKYFGLTKYENFLQFINKLKQYSTLNVSDVKVINDNLYYSDYKKVTVFRISITSGSDALCLEVNAFHEASTANQQAPVVAFRPIGGVF